MKDLEKKKGKTTLISLLCHKNYIKYCNEIILDINKKLTKYGSNIKYIKKTLNYIVYRDR